MANYTNRMQWLHGRAFISGGTLTQARSGLYPGSLHGHRGALCEDEVSLKCGMQGGLQSTLYIGSSIILGHSLLVAL